MFFTQETQEDPFNRYSDLNNQVYVRHTSNYSKPSIKYNLETKLYPEVQCHPPLCWCAPTRTGVVLCINRNLTF